MKKVKRKLLIQIADPAGNITAFVLNGARPAEYEGIAKCIFEHADYGAEQVAFVKGTDSFDMSGMEFCANATRAFALLSAKGYIDGKGSAEDAAEMDIDVSGATKPVHCEVRKSDDFTKIRMPLPKRVKTLKHCDYEPAEGCKVVVMNGIVHLIADGLEYTEDNFAKIKDALLSQFDPPALGVMYLDRESLTMTPVVYVKGVDSTYIEGSCGSGTTAVSEYLSRDKEDGEYQYEIKQPRGSILTKAVVEDGEVTSITLEGPVEISEPELIEAEYEFEDETENMDL